MKNTYIRKQSERIALKGLIVLAAFALFANTASAQITRNCERHGDALNLGLGVAYFGNLHSALYITGNYEFDVARNFTLAPFIGYTSSRSDDYIWQKSAYYYTHTVIPIGVKGTYYFDDLLGLNPKWDIYAGASLGFNYDRITWSNGYTGDKSVASAASPLYLGFHLGSEYHFNRKLGMFLDLSTVVTTVGLAIHR